MTLKDQIQEDIKTAMKAKDQDALRALRAIKSLLMLEETKEGATEITLEDEIRVLTKAVKQRKDSADIYTQQNRPDLAEKELIEVAFIEKYLPKQLSEEELRGRLQAIIAEVGAAGLKDLGKVMGQATKALAGQADGKAISAMAKALLGA
ncbi:GatB/YqeY domain-containing protein [Eisenibacter elegans]|uniref:GatB/YqeY domain-containing protein n=1 Tax=Eisenibacter elegans TaxID=997 RepID=UPI000402D042|nr:GatB/YqeY domain-containing protein [Eisenibacter elegans]